METKTNKFITSRKSHGRVFLTQWRIVTGPCELTEEHKTSRWFKAFGSAITKVEKVSVQSDMLLTGPTSTVKTEAEWAEHAKVIWADVFTIVHTSHGSACIVNFTGGSEVSGFIGRRLKGRDKAKTLGTWRKYGSKRGHGMSWLRAMAGQKLCTSPESGRDICPGEAYDRLAEGVFPSRESIANNPGWRHQAL